MWRRIEGDRAEFVVMSFWESRDAIRAFAGDDIEIAHYYPEDERFLLELDPKVTHYDVVAVGPELGSHSPGCPNGAEITPAEPDPGRAGEGSEVPSPRCSTIAASDSGGGAGIQADLKAFARLGCHGMSAIVALTAQNTTEVRAIHEAPPEFIRAQLEAIWDDIGVDAAKTGMLFSAPIVETVADVLGPSTVPLVVDPVMVAASGARLLRRTR